ncbi:hypothetical protein HZQ94_10355 [Elizabethkingia anophelis]|uniref:hypothetical protein n=1 Tax=Elizabethkingia anophelis TaxID=1117645 RepID=UPI0021A8DC4C|nr:hypothetical protein [Elizabethkingia anophelis]MCT3680840.1 hypothetical protein [Elizabethkingia anophelis]
MRKFLLYTILGLSIISCKKENPKEELEKKALNNVKAFVIDGLTKNGGKLDSISLVKIDTITEKYERLILLKYLNEKYRKLNLILDEEVNGMRLTKGVSETMFDMHKSNFDKAKDSIAIFKPFIETFDQDQKKADSVKILKYGATFYVKASDPKTKEGYENTGSLILFPKDLTIIDKPSYEKDLIKKYIKL